MSKENPPHKPSIRELFKELIQLYKIIAGSLQQISDSIQGIEHFQQRIAISTNPAPNYRKDITEFKTFDWSSIGATIITSDVEGVSVVQWNGMQFTRPLPTK